MPSLTTADLKQIWITAYNLAFARHMAEGWPAEKSVDAARDEAKAALEGAGAFLAEE